MEPQWGYDYKKDSIKGQTVQLVLLHRNEQDGDIDLFSGSECYDIIGHMTGQSASDPGPADVVKQCHKMPMELSLEDKGLFQRMTTRGGL